jgi:hypothetical protein
VTIFLPRDDITRFDGSDVTKEPIICTGYWKGVRGVLS